MFLIGPSLSTPLPAPQNSLRSSAKLQQWINTRSGLIGYVEVGQNIRVLAGFHGVWCFMVVLSGVKDLFGNAYPPLVVYPEGF